LTKTPDMWKIEGIKTMRKIMKEICLYRYEELSKQAKSTVREDNGMYNAPCLLDDDVSNMKSELKELGIINPDILYHGFNAQGDGLSFTGKISDKFVIDFIKGKKNESVIIGMIDKLSISISRYNSMYAHIVTNSDCYNAEISELERDLEGWMIAKCRKFYKDLEDEYNYICSEEYAIDSAINNDYWYTADGKIYR
jgi:hypothetical protein